MTAKSELLQVLQDSSLSKTAMCSDAHAIARAHKMSTDYICKCHSQAFGEVMKKPESVEAAVRILVDRAFSGLHNEGLEESYDGAVSSNHSSEGGRDDVDQGDADSDDDGAHTGTTAVSTCTCTSKTDFDELSTMLRTLVKSFDEERTAALDREKRLHTQIQELTREIKQLSTDLNDAKIQSALKEDRLTKQLNDMKSRISSPYSNKAIKTAGNLSQNVASSSALKSFSGIVDNNKPLGSSKTYENRQDTTKNHEGLSSAS